MPRGSTYSSEQRLALTVAILATFVAFLDTSAINVTLPAIEREVGGGLSTQQWVVDAYLLTLSSLILVAGSMSDVFGRIVVLRAGLIGFGITSVLIALAPTAELLILMRGLQGVAGALLVPSSFAIIISHFRDAAQARAIGIWTAWGSVAFLTGPLLGGLFVDFLSWRFVFGINVLPIAATLWLVTLLKQRDQRAVGVRIDYVGAVLGVVGLGGPVFALIEQGNHGWDSPLVWVPCVVGVACLALFILWERRAKQPMLPLGIFGVRNFAFGNLAVVFVSAAQTAGNFVVVVFLQEVAGYPATVAALAFIPVSIGSIILSGRFGTLAGRYGPRLFATVGPFLSGAGYLLMLNAGEQVDYLWHLLPGILLFAVGMSATLAPLTSAILGSIPPHQAGIASATNNAISRVSALISTAMIGVILAGPMSVDGFHRMLVFIGALMFTAGIVAFFGIRNPVRRPDAAGEPTTTTEPAAP